MAGLGLSAAVDRYQQGVAWQQQQGEMARQQQQRAQLDEANRAATGVIQASQQEWAANGAQGQYRPNDATMFKAAEARGMALAKAGMWDQFLANDAQVAPMRIKARAGALQQYEADGDVEKLARTVYPTLFDGKEIVGSKKIQGADGSVNLGLMPIPSKIELELSDGTKRAMDPEDLVKMVKSSLIDPVAAAKKEVEINYLRTKELIEGAGRERLERVKFGYQRQIHADDRASAERVGAGNNAATLGAARIGAEARVNAAGLSAGGKDGDKGTKRDAEFAQLAKHAANLYGDTMLGLAGGSKNENEASLSIARGAQELRRLNPGVSVGEAIAKAGAEWKKRNPAWKPATIGGGQ